MGEIVKYIVGGAVMLLSWYVLIKQFVGPRYGKLHTVKARVVNKYTQDLVAPKSPTGKMTRYVIVFEIGGKKKGFYVSEFSYSGYRINESGTLKYRGDRIIDFQ